MISLSILSPRHLLFSGTLENADFDRVFAQKKSGMLVYLAKTYGLTDNKVLRALKKINRDKFIEKEFQGKAYEDISLPIGYGQTISPIHSVALMTQVLGLKGGERVLEIGTGSGYQAAVLAEIVSEVYTIEIIEGLAKEAEARLNNMGYTNIKFKVGDGFMGWQEFAPFDAIVVTAAVDKIPQPLLDQLAEGARMIIPISKPGGDQGYVLVKKIDGKISQSDNVIICQGPHFVPMTGEHTGIAVPKDRVVGQEK